MYFWIPADDFDLEATLNSGQVFGFVRDGGGAYEGVLAGRIVRLFQRGTHLRVGSDISRKQIELLIRDYFDLERDLTPVYQALRSEERLSPVLNSLKGLRLIRQDGWEALACFIISSNNNVKRIQGIWRRLARHFHPGQNVFPQFHEIAESGETLLRRLGLGYRAPYLFRTAQLISRNREILRFVQTASYPEAKMRLMELPGIGSKVADCVLLYGFQKYEAFPVDVWVFRAMKKLYFRNRSVNERKVMEFGQKRWGPLAGYVQQYIFHGARTGVIEV